MQDRGIPFIRSPTIHGIQQLDSLVTDVDDIRPLMALFVDGNEKQHEHIDN